MNRHRNHPERSSQPDAYSMQGYGAAVGAGDPTREPQIRYQARQVHRPVNVYGIHEPSVASQIAYGTDYPITPEYGSQNVANTQYTGLSIPDLGFTQFDGYLDDNPFTFVHASAPSEYFNGEPSVRLDTAPINATAPIAAPVANTQYTGFPELGFTQFDDILDNNLSSCARPPAPSQSLNAGPIIAPTITAAPAARPVTNGRLPCTHIGCTQSFQHQHDLTRHMKGHKTGAKDFNCPFRDCPRQGVNGFTRKDKLMDHLKGKHKW